MCQDEALYASKANGGHNCKLIKFKIIKLLVSVFYEDKKNCK